VDSAGDAVIEAAGEGSDRVLAAASYALTSNSEVELLTTIDQSATTVIDIVGNDFGQAIFGNAGTNSLAGAGGNDTLWGLVGNDVLDGGLGADNAVGGAGDDIYAVDNGADLVFETAGNGSDRVLVYTGYALGAGAEVELLATANQASVQPFDLTGNELANNIQANNGANTLRGLGGNDVLFGLDGDDVLIGGGGVDQLNGGAGADTHVFGDALGPTNIDLVFGFVSGADRIQLDNAVFTALADGPLPAGAFNLGATASEADDRILYDQATGRLFYDADGTGAAAATHFATLVGNPIIAAGDFAVI
jgi:Ca2+-binding RTX toxin-like protein